MAGLAPVIRLHQWTLDEKRRALLAVRAEEDRVLAAMADLEERVKSEQGTAREAPDVAFAYRAFADAALQRRSDLETKLAEVRERVQAAADEVAEAYEELKKVETTEENRLAAEARERERQEQAIMDELAIVQHIINQD